MFNYCHNHTQEITSLQHFIEASISQIKISLEDAAPPFRLMREIGEEENTPLAAIFKGLLG